MGWPRRCGPGRGGTGPACFKLGFAGEKCGYAVDLGMPLVGATRFGLDPEITAEAVWAGPWLRPSALIADRDVMTARIRDDDGTWRVATTSLLPCDSMLSQIAERREAIELLGLRERMRSWRFYDHVRTDRSAPARRVQI